MKISPTAKELIDRYLLAVKRQLAGKQRDDITAELETYILDTIEEKYPNDEEFSDDMVISVLTGMGAPFKVASQYRSHQYLIGPRLYPIFVIVIKIIVAVIIGALSISALIAFFTQENGQFLTSLLEYLGSIWSGVLAAIGAVTVVFALINRAVLKEKHMEEIENFEKFVLADLPELPQTEKKFNTIGTIVEIALGIVGISFLIFSFRTAGGFPYFCNTDSGIKIAKIFSSGFVSLIPFMIAQTGLEIGRNGLLLAQGYHSAVTNWWNICNNIINVAVMAFIIRARPILDLSSTEIAQVAPQVDFTNIARLGNFGLIIALAIGLAATCVETIIGITREIRNPTSI